MRSRRRRGRGVGGEEEESRRKIGHIIHESDWRTIFRCIMSIYSLTSFNMCT